MKDHEKRNLVTDLCATAVQFHAAEQLRDRIARLVLAALERAEIQAAANERERIAAHFDERDRGPDGKPLGHVGLNELLDRNPQRRGNDGIQRLWRLRLQERQARGGTQRRHD